MAGDKEMVHVRLPRPLIRRIDHLAVDEDLFRGGAMEQLLAWAVDEAETRGKIPQLEPVEAR